ncbi:hypothetical protein niasHS_007954 [Heterodera schachtii]|uniref:Uncharacterized protein n=1 Tax=Heterodera schachtii TaxID=97005 RepID=A0ABD2JQ33_HETSC
MLICQFAFNVVINYALMSKSMTGAEVENCAEVLSWFNVRSTWSCVHSIWWTRMAASKTVSKSTTLSLRAGHARTTRWDSSRDAARSRRDAERDARRCKQFKLWRTDGRGAGGAIPRVGVDNRNREGKFIRAAQQQPQQ